MKNILKRFWKEWNKITYEKAKKQIANLDTITVGGYTVSPSDIEKALRAVGRLEQADAKEATFDYCNNVECDGVCDECYTLVDFKNGYEQALKDVRGDNE